MSRVFKRNLVIDACFAHLPDSRKTVSVNSSIRVKFLDEVYKHTNRHKMVLSSKLEEEWKRHAKGYGLTWYVRMVSKRRVCDVGDPDDIDLRELIECSDLFTASQRNAALKDAHLIEAANKADLIVVSLDKKVEKLFAELAPQSPSLSPVMWVDPTQGFSEVIVWIGRGAKYDTARTFGAPKKKTQKKKYTRRSNSARSKKRR